MRTHIQLDNLNRSELPKKYQDEDVRYSENRVEYFLREYTQEKDIVFDPFAGFGTTLMVAESIPQIGN